MYSGTYAGYGSPCAGRSGFRQSPDKHGIRFRLERRTAVTDSAPAAKVAKVAKIGVREARPPSGGEPQAQAADRGPQPRQAHPAGRSVKKALTPGRQRELVASVQASHGVSQRRSCLALDVDRSLVRYVSVKPDQAPLRLRIHDLAQTRMRYGYYRIYIMLRREGWLVNHKRVYRLYRQDGLSLRLKKPRRNVSAADRVRQPAAAAPNEMWSMDFVSDALFDERHLRALNIVDTYTREALAIDVDQGIKGEQVVEAMARIAGTRGTRTADSC